MQYEHSEECAMKTLDDNLAKSGLHKRSRSHVKMLIGRKWGKQTLTKAQELLLVDG